MRGVAADDRLVAPARGADAQHVGAAAVEDEEGRGLITEVRLEQALDVLGERVVAVAGGMADVGGGDGLQHLGVDGGVVVGSEAAARTVRVTRRA